MAIRKPRTIAALALLLSFPSLPPQAGAADPALPAAPAAPPPGLAPLFDVSSLAPFFDVSALALLPLDFIAVPGSAEILVEIEAGAATWTLLLEPHTLRSDRFQVLVDDGGGTLLPHPAPPVRTRRGRVLEVPGSRVRASFDGSRLRAMIHAGGETWVVQPAEDAGVAAGLAAGTPAGPLHVVHAAADALAGPFHCAASAAHGGALAAGPLSLGSTLALAEIAADADFEYFTLNGSSIDDTVLDIEAVLNGVEGVYEDDPTGIAYELTAVVVRTASPDPYGAEASPAALLSAFGTVWNASPESAIPRDVAHLFTGVVLTGSTIGHSNHSEICTAGSLGLSRSLYTANWASRVALTSHELGHNWSATHCDGAPPCRILCSSIGGCDGLSPLAFEPASADAIADYRSTLPCLSTRPPPRSLPILDEFTVNAIDPLLWIHVDGAIISSQGIGEPSGPNSLDLDAAGPGPYDADELRSNRILLGGSIDPVLGVFVEHRGVEAGEELVIEYLDPLFHWRELDRIASDGTDQVAYVPYTYLLPADARHDGFRVRFRAEVDAPDDDWYLDDFTIEAAGVGFIRGDANGDGIADIADAVAILGHLFASAPAPCLDALDANDDGAADIADAVYLLGFLFSGGAPPPSPHPAAGADPTADPLVCAP